MWEKIHLNLQKSNINNVEHVFSDMHTKVPGLGGMFISWFPLPIPPRAMLVQHTLASKESFDARSMKLVISYNS